MKVSVLGRTSKGKLDFEVKSDDEFGFTVRCVDGEGILIYHNVKSFRWIERGRIVYMDTPIENPLDQYTFDLMDEVKITKAKKIADEPFEHHYLK